MKFIIKSDIDIDNMALAVQARLSFKEKPLEVSVINLDDSLSAKQRRLYFRWLRIISEEIEGTKDNYDYYHKFYKEKYLLKIFIGDDIKIELPDKEIVSFSDLATKMSEIKQTMPPKHYEFVRENFMSEYVSITRSSTNIMARYTNLIYKDAGELGIQLPLPEDRGLLEC